MHASRTLLSPLIAALVLCAFGAPSAWGWGVEAQRTLPGVTNADRAVVDSNGDIYLLDQFGGTSEFDGGGTYAGDRYSVRIWKVSADLGTVTQLGATRVARAYGPIADPILDGPYSLPRFSLSPSGMAIDPSARRLYVATGESVSALSLTDGTWETVLAPAALGTPGDWRARRVVAGSVAVDSATRDLYVADFGSGSAGDFIGDVANARGTVRLQVFDADTGAFRREAPNCADSASTENCLFGRFEDTAGVDFFGSGATSLLLTPGASTPRLKAIHTRHGGTADAPFDVPEIQSIDAASGAAASLRAGIGTRPLGGLTGQTLEIVADGAGGFVAPAIKALGGPSSEAVTGLLRLDEDGGAGVEFMPVSAVGDCALRGRLVRLAAGPGAGGDGQRLVVVEDRATPGSIRVTILRAGRTGCAETPSPPRQAPSLSGAFTWREAGDNPRTVAITEGTGPGAVQTVELPITRDVSGAIQPGLSGGTLGGLSLTDEDTPLGSNVAPWAFCTWTLPGTTGRVGALGDGNRGDCEASVGVPGVAVERPVAGEVTVVDDDGDTASVSLKLVSIEPLRADFSFRAETPELVTFDLDETCEAESCAEPAAARQLSLGPIDTWELEFGDGERATGDWRDIHRPLTHEYDENGTFTVTLTLKAAGKPDAVATRTITVDRGDTSTPVADLTAAPASVTRGTPMTFTPRNTGTGTVASWTLTFGDGDETSGTGDDLLPVTHTYRATGSFTVRLSIQLTNGKSASTTQTVTVAEPEKQQVPGQVAIKSCLTPFGIPLSILGLGDQSLCTADVCDLDLAQLGLTNMGIERPARCSAGGAGAELEGAGEAVAPLGARGRIASSRLTLSRDGRIAIRVRCLDGAGACAGTVALDLRPATGGSRRLWTVRFSRLPVGARRTLRVRPAAAARAALVTEISRRLRRGQRAAVRLKVSPSATPATITRPSAQTTAGTISASRSTVRALSNQPAAKRRTRT